LTEKFDAGVGERAAAWLNAIAGDLPVPDELQEIFSAIEARFGSGRLRFDPTLVRGMGYYTGTIFEIEHPESGSSIGGGGRYDGMVGRWLGTDAPAVGISIGFERAVDLVESRLDNTKLLVLVLDSASPSVIGNALNVQQQAIEAGYRVRLEQRPKKLNNLLDSMAEQGFGSFATIGEEFVNFADLAPRSIAN
jgi:histidyl-tRNA synthetase